MKNTKCYLCGEMKFEAVKGKVRDIPDMPVLRCRKCGLVFLGNFNHIDENFYQESRMRAKQDIEDWKTYLKECALDDERRARWLKSDIAGKAVLDFGCGGGGFLKEIKGIAKRFAGVEKDVSLKKLIEKNFGASVYSDIDEVKGKFDLITMFHVLEHFKDPRDIITKLSNFLNIGGRIIIEVPNADDALLSIYESGPFSKFTYWGCHLYLFNEKTLRKMVESTGLLVDNIRQVQRYPLSNHLYWLAKGKPGGHKIWDFIDDEELNRMYEAKLAGKRACDTIIVTIKKSE